MLHSLPTFRNLYVKKLSASRRVSSLFIILFSLLIIWVYQSFFKSTAFPISSDCKQSLIESDGFFCEPTIFWNERKRLFHLQDKLNVILRPGDYFFARNWQPNFYCSYPQRIGAEVDGGKWVCDPYRLKLQHDCLIYSVGSNGDFSFETELKNFMSHCEIHTFDKNLFQCPTNTCTFHQTTFGDGIKPDNSKNWKTILRELNHTNRFIDILKIDIEGGEYTFFPQLLNSMTNALPRQILVEIHPANITTIHEFFNQMRQHHYVNFMKENNLIAGPFYFEYSFLKLNSRFFV